ncbi:MAG: capsular polysaccharide biosynthesis protein [Planctomycetota bacterium]|jgi:capsular polysaccharide biosynthesis protein
MAIAIESQGQVAELLGILKRRKWQLILPLLFGLALGTAVAVFVPKKFLINTTLELRERSAATDAGTAAGVSPTTTDEIANATHHIRHYNRIKGIIESEGWTDYIVLDDGKKMDFIESVRENLSVVVHTKSKENKGSTFMDIKYKALDADRGVRFLGTLSQKWLDDVVDRERNQLREERKVLLEEVSEARSKWRDASDDVELLVREGGISPAEVEGDKNDATGDPDFLRLTASKNELIDLKVELAVLEVREATQKELIASTPTTIPIDVIEEGLDLGAKIAEIEGLITKARLEQSKFTTRNTGYHKLAIAIKAAEKQKASYEANQRSQTIVQQVKANPLLASLYATQDNLVMKMSEVTGRISLVQMAVDSDVEIRATKTELLSSLYVARAERDLLWTVLEVANDRYQAKNMRLQALTEAYGKPYEYVQDATAPEKATEPDPFLITMIVMMLGLGIGVGSAVVGEFGKDGFRTAADIGRSMDLPILGVVDRIWAPAEIRARFFRRAIVGISSLVVICALFAFTWAFALNPERLPVEWLETLEGLRLSLR